MTQFEFYKFHLSIDVISNKLHAKYFRHAAHVMTNREVMKDIQVQAHIILV